LILIQQYKVTIINFGAISDYMAFRIILEEHVRHIPLHYRPVRPQNEPIQFFIRELHASSEDGGYSAL